MSELSLSKDGNVDQAAFRTSHAPEKIGIYRAFNSQRGGFYLHVSLNRNGKLFQKYFSEKQCGGEDHAMRLAQAWRDKIIAQYPPMSMKQFCSIVRSNNTTGVAGVGRSIKRSRVEHANTSNLIYWHARIPFPDGTFRVRYFSVLRFGEEGAKALAVDARIGALNDLDGVAFREKHQPLATSTTTDIAVLDATVRKSAEKKLRREGERAAKKTQDADRVAEKLSHAVSTEKVALSMRTNRSGEPYIGRYKTPTGISFYWDVSMIRQGTRHRKRFSDSIFGGADEALHAARMWRDQLFATLPVASKAQVASRLKANNTSGVVGVTRVRVLRKGQSFQYWVAQSPMVKGQPKRTKGYSIEKHGEIEALALARKAREAYLEEVREVGFFHHRAARKMLQIIEKSTRPGTRITLALAGDDCPK